MSDRGILPIWQSGFQIGDAPSLREVWNTLEHALFDENTSDDARADSRFAFYMGARYCADLLQIDRATVLHEISAFLAEQEPT